MRKSVVLIYVITHSFPLSENAKKGPAFTFFFFCIDFSVQVISCCILHELGNIAYSNDTD